MPPSTIATTPPDLRRFRQLGQSASRTAMAALLQAQNLLGLSTGRHCARPAPRMTPCGTSRAAWRRPS